MNVYVLDTRVLSKSSMIGVFSTKEKAKQMMCMLAEHHPFYYEDMVISEIALDAGSEEVANGLKPYAVSFSSVSSSAHPTSYIHSYFKFNYVVRRLNALCWARDTQQAIALGNSQWLKFLQGSAEDVTK